jgi:hypothetical protein
VEWLKVKALSSSPSTEEKKKKKELCSRSYRLVPCAVQYLL